MVIECSSCQARFKLADDKIKETGTKVRCTKCHGVFVVFPESPPIAAPVIATVPVSPIPSVVAPQKGALDAAAFAGTDISPPKAETPPPPAVDAPVKGEEGWNQHAASKVADEAGATDLDAIRFDNVESPVFSITSEKEQPFKITAATDEQSLSGESVNDFDDFSSSSPALPALADLSHPVVTAGEFSLSETDNLADFSWNEPDTTPGVTTPPEQSKGTEAPVQDTAFDFSSFSFDDADDTFGSAKKNGDEINVQSESTIELSLATGTRSAPVETRLPPIEVTPSPVAREHQAESPPRVARPLHPRLRQTKKSSSRLAVKLIMLILLAVTATYGVMNRDQIQKLFKNSVSSFIENQSLVKTSGRIGLVKLSGYVLNGKEGDLFVIRGEAINEFKELRSSVLVRGTIYDDNGAVLLSQSAYCGNPLSDSSLKNLGFKEIHNVMSNELGENLVNLDIAPGKGIPFTIVFNKVPNNIKEFTVEVLESKPGAK